MKESEYLDRKIAELTEKKKTAEEKEKRTEQDTKEFIKCLMNPHEVNMDSLMDRVMEENKTDSALLREVRDELKEFNRNLKKE